MRPLARQQLAGPIALTGYICGMAAAAFLVAVRGLPAWYQALVGMGCCSAVGNLWLTALTDPGSLPKNTEPDPLVQQLEAGLLLPASGEFTRSTKGAWMRRLDATSSSSSSSSGSEAWSKYCSTCHNWRPPRSHHCSTCNACMVHWDHHCAVVGDTCIALRNHRFFTGFLLSAQLCCLLALGGAIWRLQQRGLPRPGGPWMGTTSFLLLLEAVVFGYHAVVLVFGTLHCCAIVLDITTKDLLTDRQLWRRSAPCCPGSRRPAALVRAWRALCCLPLVPRSWAAGEAAAAGQQQQQQQQQQHRRQRQRRGEWRRVPGSDADAAAAVAVADSSGMLPTVVAAASPPPSIAAAAGAAPACAETRTPAVAIDGPEQQQQQPGGPSGLQPALDDDGAAARRAAPASAAAALVASAPQLQQLV